MVSRSAACRSERAHKAARTAATAGRARGTPLPVATSSADQRRVCRMLRPRPRRTFAPRGTDTRVAVVAYPVRPAATSADSPSTKARGPASKTAAQSHAACGTGPVCTQMLWLSSLRQRAAFTLASTSARVRPAAYTWRRLTTPACSAARARTRRRRCSRSAAVLCCPVVPIDDQRAQSGRRRRPRPAELWTSPALASSGPAPMASDPDDGWRQSGAQQTPYRLPARHWSRVGHS